MNGPLDFVAHPEIALLRVLVAGLVGGLIGMERERAAQESGEEMFAGVRTFPLFAILGASLAIVSGSIGAAVVSGFLAVTALAVVAYWRTSTPEHAGVTTEGAALATYWVGAMAGAGALTLAGAVGITIAVLLAAKERLESFPRAMSREELRATLTLAVIAAVILPLLPDRGYGPWEVWNPRRIWLVVVFVCGLSFAAFLAVRFWGAKKGVYATGILGGLASSTALTASLASQSRVLEKAGAYLAVGAGLASTVMLIRVAVLAAIAGPSVLPSLWPFLAAAALGSILAIVLLARRARTTPAEGAGLDNPFQLKEALRFGAIFAVVLLAVEAARHSLGSWGVLVASVLAGLVDVDAITLSLSGMSARGMPPEIAAGGIAAAVLANTAAKAGYAAWRGSAEYRRGVGVILGLSFAAGSIVMIVMSLRA